MDGLRFDNATIIRRFIGAFSIIWMFLFFIFIPINIIQILTFIFQGALIVIMMGMSKDLYEEYNIDERIWETDYFWVSLINLFILISCQYTIYGILYLIILISEQLIIYYKNLIIYYKNHGRT